MKVLVVEDALRMNGTSVARPFRNSPSPPLLHRVLASFAIFVQ